MGAKEAAMNVCLASPFVGIAAKLVELYRRASDYIKISRASGIIRRYFATNAFDGAMTTLGILVGMYATGSVDPKIVVSVVMSTGMALWISGFASVYVIETAEREKALEDLESSVHSDLENTVLANASRFVSLLSAVIDGSAPLLMSIISITPFIAGLFHPYSAEYAVLASISIIFALLFLLGYYLGARLKGTRLAYGLKMLAAGIIAAALSVFLRAL